MTTAAEAVLAAIAGGRGERPNSLKCEEAEVALNVAMALLVELCAATDRIGRLERELAAIKGEPIMTWREAPSTEDAIEERQNAIEAMQLRVLRIFVDPRANRS